MSESPSNQLLNAMRALQKALDWRDARISAASSLGRNDWLCLRWLAQEGARSPGALRRRLGLTSGSVTALLDRLENRGVVRRCADPDDRRALRVEPSAKGDRLVREAARSLDQIMHRLTLRRGTDRSSAAPQACCDLAKLVEWAAQRA